jgi:Secretion system C-terminal sorting domain
LEFANGMVLIWDTITSGTNGPVTSLFVDSINNRLYVGGQFTMAGGISCPTGVAYWDGNNWFNVGTNPHIPAEDLIIYNGILYNASNQYIAVNSLGDTIEYVAWFDGLNWNPVPGGVSATALRMLPYKNELYFGGAFEFAGDSLVLGIAKWHPGSLNQFEISQNSANIQLTPNPSLGEVLFEVELRNFVPTSLLVQIIDSKGAIVFNENFVAQGLLSKSLNISTLGQGMYTLTVINEKKYLGSKNLIIN